eukprot:GFKZ01005957.1.p1 GENE.GFKZ01005957.1~~GFKZ01005957.1.p1  ORF type:complete len:817 (-),score=111.10 GFKZ01005957.1:563-2668(-)
MSRNRSTLFHLLPFLLNTLLYGLGDYHTASSSRGGSSRTKKGSNLKISKDPKDITLGGTSHLVKAQCERQLESFLYQQAMNSVSFALECLWYFTGSLYLGPKESYHRTMTLLLGIESVVTNSTPPGDLFKKANLRETSATSSSAVDTPDSSTSPDQVHPSDPSAPIRSPVLPPMRSPSIRQVDLDISGSGQTDTHVQFNLVQVADEAKLQHWLDARRERASIFHAQLDFVKCLTHISHRLFDVERELRRDVLRRELERLNDFIPSNVVIPTERRPHRVLRIVPEDAHVFSTKERVPYLLVVEVEDLAPNVPENQEEPKHSPLRRIGSLSAPGPRRGHGGSSTGAQRMNEDLSDNIDEPMPNQPESRFSFAPDVTVEAGSGLAGMKRESSFRFDTQHNDDRRPPDEELLKALGEPWAEKSERLRRASPFGDNPNWRLVSCIVKSRDQLRQEMFAQRLIQEFARIFERNNVDVWLRPYQIISTSSDSGLIETLTDSISIDSLKKHSPNVVTLQDYFVGRFGGRGSSEHKRAVRAFVQSMAGYSIVQYLLNIKDRHNGNLMIDSEGHVIHIDYGFLLSNSPGGNMEFEKSPFKLTHEMVQVMGGTNSTAWKLYRKLCVQGYVEACRYSNKVMLMVDMAYPGNESMPCFLQGREYVLENLRERFGVDLSRKERAARMLKLIDYAKGNWTTKAYDQYQKVSLGIAR